MTNQHYQPIIYLIMKKIFTNYRLIIAFCVLSFCSCDKEGSSVFNEPAQFDTSKSSQRFAADSLATANSTAADPQFIVGFEGSNGALTFTGNKSEILQKWNANLITMENIDAKLTQITMFKDGTEYFIRAIGPQYVSTVLLKKNLDSSFSPEGISCTSEVCATTNGCVPKKDKKSCTECSVLGHCTKTVTAGKSMLTHYLATIDRTAS